MYSMNGPLLMTSLRGRGALLLMRCVKAGLLFSYNSEKIGSRVTLDGSITLNGRANSLVEGILKQTMIVKHKRLWVDEKRCVRGV